MSSRPSSRHRRARAGGAARPPQAGKGGEGRAPARVVVGEADEEQRLLLLAAGGTAGRLEVGAGEAELDDARDIAERVVEHGRRAGVVARVLAGARAR